MTSRAAPYSRVFRLCLTLCLMLISGVQLAGCDGLTNALKHDRSGNKEAQDFRDALAPRLPDVSGMDNKTGDGAGAATANNIPSLQPYVAAPDTNVKPMPLVSVSVNQSVPLRDILFELAQQANYDLELDPRITGSIIFTARDRPFDEVVSRIADIAGLRYKFDNDVLRVELDTPYNKVYKIDYLSYVRSNKGSIRNNVAVVTGDGADTGSSYEAASQSEANFWGELEQNMQQILGGTVSGALKTRKTPKVTATDQNPNVQAVVPQPAGDAKGGDKGNKDMNVQVQPPQAVLKVESLPSDEEDDTANGQSANNSNANGFTFAINKQAGLINIYASEKAQKQVEEYLKLLRRAVTAQVLIEAKVLEVDLNDQNSTGIDWRFLDLSSPELTLNFLSDGAGQLLDTLGPGTSNIPVTADTETTNSSFVAGYVGNDAQALIRAISQFGTVKALASPRLTVLNNQSAVLNVATNHVFFDVNIDVTTDQDTGRTVDIDSDIHNVPEGVLVNVQPSINLDNGTIALAVRPTVTRIVGEKPDPAVQFVTATADPPITNVQSLVPELNVQEIDSVLQVRSGQPVVMGGLLQDRSAATDTGVPVVSETPILGALFKNHGDTIQKSELVIFLKATILDQPGDSIDNTDKDLYRAFSGDRRPLKL